MRVKYSHPHFPDGQLFGIYPFGQLANNGEAVEVDEAALASYKEENGVSVEEAFANDPHLTIEGGNAKKETKASSAPEVPTTKEGVTGNG